MKDPLELQNEATTRYLTDPEFHYRVRVAASLVEWTARQEGITLSMAQHATIVQASAYGVLIASEDIDDTAAGLENHEHMQHAAAAMGMTIVPKMGE